MTEAVANLLGRFERMERIDQFAFYRQISGLFITTIGWPCYTTSNFDAMTRFLEDIGMRVEITHDQLCPLFNRSRAARVDRGDVRFNLEESTDGNPATPFNLFLTGYESKDFERLDCLGYGERHEPALYGVSYSFTSPDGGKILIT